MKKYIVLLTIVFLLTGCGCTKDLNIKFKQEDIRNISTAEFQIPNNHYNDIITVINNLKFKEEEFETSGIYTPLYINYQDKLYAYAIYENEIIKLSYEDKKYYLKNEKQVTVLLDKIKNIQEDIKKSEQHVTKYFETYENPNSFHVIDLDTGNNMLQVTFQSNISDLMVYSQKIDKTSGYIDGNGKENFPFVRDEKLGSLASVKQGETIIIKYQKNKYPYDIIITYKDSTGSLKKLTLK